MSATTLRTQFAASTPPLIRAVVALFSVCFNAHSDVYSAFYQCRDTRSDRTIASSLLRCEKACAALFKSHLSPYHSEYTATSRPSSLLALPVVSTLCSFAMGYDHPTAPPSSSASRCGAALRQNGYVTLRIRHCVASPAIFVGRGAAADRSAADAATGSIIALLSESESQ